VKRDLRAEVRTLLLAKPEGITASQLMVETGASYKSVRHSLSSMPDVYIDRWEFPRQGPLAAVFCAVVVPENCPRPTRLKRTEAEKKEYHRSYTEKWHKAKPKPPVVRESQGLTTIRGPWPMP
jgi:hypothetical protein